MSAYDTRSQRCECCGIIPEDGCTPYGEADDSGHVWTHYACASCRAACTSDENGNPVHVAPVEAATHD